MVKKPWLAKKKILEAMELRLDAAIDKTENLARDVEIDHMMKKFDALMEKAHDEKVSVMVAEPESQYGAEVFEAANNGRDATENIFGGISSDQMGVGKFR